LYVNTNRTIRDSLGEAGFPVPETAVAMRSVG